MRKGISLIELIFTIVIIGVVFTVIPKIVLALSKSDEFSIKQDALFNGVTMMQMISRLSWDENSTNGNDILNTQSTNPNLTCNAISGNYRIGGFRGSRNCENNVTLAGIGKEAGETSIFAFDDIDDFDDNGTTTSVYRLAINVNYLGDNIVYNVPTRNATIDLSQNTFLLSTNLKLVDINITYQGNKAVRQGTPISQFSFVSANIGKFFLAKRTW